MSKVLAFSDEYYGAKNPPVIYIFSARVVEEIRDSWMRYHIQKSILVTKVCHDVKWFKISDV